MIDPNTPLEEIAEMCNSMEDLCNLLKQSEYKKTIEDDIQISPKLLQEAILKTKHLKTVTISDIQKLLRVGYPKAAKLYELITTSKINEKCSLLKIICPKVVITAKAS